MGNLQLTKQQRSKKNSLRAALLWETLSFCWSESEKTTRPSLWRKEESYDASGYDYETLNRYLDFLFEWSI